MNLSSFDVFGSADPRKMPTHFFRGAKFVDYDSAIRADTTKQDFSVAPRHWYLDSDFDCAKCRSEFTWTAQEQRAWFEQYRFWVDSCPRLCRACKAAERGLEDLRREYDASVAAAREHGSIDQKLRIIFILRELQNSLAHLPEKMLATLELFEHQTSAGR
jgi:hypothetical protein